MDSIAAGHEAVRASGKQAGSKWVERSLESYESYRNKSLITPKGAVSFSC